jgi:hypothetical protein
MTVPDKSAASPKVKVKPPRRGNDASGSWTPASPALSYATTRAEARGWPLIGPIEDDALSDTPP